MIEPHVIELARKKIELLIAEQGESIDRGVATVKARAATRGMLGSSVCDHEVAQVCSEAVRERAKFVWHSLKEHLQAANTCYAPKLHAQVTGFISEFVQDSPDWAQSRVDEAMKFLTNQGMKQEIARQVKDANRRALQEVAADVDLFVLQLKNRKSTEMTGAPIQIFNSKNVTVQQAGRDLAGTVTQILENHSNADVIALLEEIKDAIQSLASVPGHNKQDLVELIDDAKSEVTRPVPNKSKLKGHFHALVDAVQGISTLVDKGSILYERLKGWVEAAGLSLS